MFPSLRHTFCCSNPTPALRGITFCATLSQRHLSLVPAYMPFSIPTCFQTASTASTVQSAIHSARTRNHVPQPTAHFLLQYPIYALTFSLSILPVYLGNNTCRIYLHTARRPTQKKETDRMMVLGRPAYTVCPYTAHTMPTCLKKKGMLRSVQLLRYRKTKCISHEQQERTERF